MLNCESTCRHFQQGEEVPIRGLLRVLWRSVESSIGDQWPLGDGGDHWRAPAPPGARHIVPGHWYHPGQCQWSHHHKPHTSHITCHWAAQAGNLYAALEINIESDSMDWDYKYIKVLQTLIRSRKSTIWKSPFCFKLFKSSLLPHWSRRLLTIALKSFYFPLSLLSR